MVLVYDWRATLQDTTVIGYSSEHFVQTYFKDSKNRMTGLESPAGRPEK